MKYILIVTLLVLPWAIFAAYLEDIPSQVSQPDGSLLSLFASGDEYANYLHDARGYTIIQSPTDGYYYYAMLSGGEPVPSAHRVGSIDPASLGVSKRINISKAAYEAKRALMQAPERRSDRAPNTGTVNNLNVFIRFVDQTEFELPRSFYDARFNAVGDSVNSLKTYFHKVSYDQLDYDTHHFPICEPEINLSYQDSHPRSYFMPFNALTNPDGYSNSDERALREQTMLAAAISSIAQQVPSSLNIDADNDNQVDNVCFIIRGPHTAWADLLWAHRWVLYYADAYINGKQVWDFTFQPEDQNSVRTLCHEMFHSVGAPDLYHYTFNGVTPAGCWDIMESGGGHMGMYMKYKYGGWLSSLPVATPGNTYTLHPVTSPDNNVYKVAIPGSYNQYLVLEYRKRGSDIYEAELPGSGLLIYRIQSYLDGNSEGPPDEVYIYRPNGSNTINGQIFDAAFSAEVCHTEFNAHTNPHSFLSNGSSFEININSIGYAGDTITFTLSPSTDPLPPVISSISPASGSILANSTIEVSAQVSAPNSTLSQVEILVNGIPVSNLTAEPYTAVIDVSGLPLGSHVLSVVAYAVNGLQTTRDILIYLIDPEDENWFSWQTAAPVWSEFGRGAVPISVAVDFDLGTQEYLLKAIRFNAVPDPWGQPTMLGKFSARINRMANGAMTEQTLIDLGDIYNQDYEQDFTYEVADSTRISGQIAFILDCYQYQNILFDENSICGHTWLTEPDRPWTDALARGMLGAASMSLLLQDPTVGNGDELLVPASLQLSCYPNPARSMAKLAFSLKNPAPVKLSIYNLKGQKVKTLSSDEKQAGNHELSWDGSDDNGQPVSNGCYIVRLQSGKQSVNRKLIYLK